MIRNCFTLLLFLLILPAATAVGQDLAAQERASNLIDEEKYSDAINLLNELITPETRDARPLLLRARAHERRGDSMGASRDYQRVLEIDPANREARDGLQRTTGTDRLMSNNNLESLRRLVSLNPDNLSYRIRLADALFEARRFRDAADEYGEYLDRTQGSPDVVQSYLIAIAGYDGDNALGERIAKEYTRVYSTNDDLYMRLGYFRIWQGKFKLAEEPCEQALKLNPKNREARDCLGIARDPDLAGAASQYPVDVLMRELRADPADDAKRFELIDLLVDAGRYFEAQQQLDRLAPRHRGSQAWNSRYMLVENRLQTEPEQQRPRQLFIVDRLYNDLKADSTNDTKRFRLVEELVKYERYQEAYDQLLILEPEYGYDDRWLTSFLRVDKGLMSAEGTSTIYPVDRFTFLLRATPNDMQLRFRLVDQLTSEERYAEAYDVLVDPEYSDPTTPGYRARLQKINEVRIARARERIAELESILEDNPNDEQALREIIDNYKVLDMTDEAIRAYARLIQLRPDDTEVRADYVETLRLSGYTEQAVKQASWLFNRRPQDSRIMRLFAMSQLTNNTVTERGESAIAELLAGPAANDTELLVATAAYRLSNAELEATEFLLDRAEATDDSRFDIQIETLRQLLARERLRAQQQAYAETLNEARRLAAAERYDAAISTYEQYFEARGKRTREELKELAGVYSAAEQYEQALSVLFSLQQEVYEYSVAKDIARAQNAREDYSGALATLERLRSENPRDYEVRFMQAAALRQLGLYEQAKDVYNEALMIADDSEDLEARKVAIDADIRSSLAQSGERVGMDFAGIIVPTADGTRARGGGTQYDRWAQGMQTQVTTPVGLVVMAGINSHFMSGSRRLVPGAQIVRGRVNQIWTGGYYDFTPPIKSDRASYTNRLSFDFGLYDYEGARTVTYGNLRYWRQEPGVYNGSISLHTGEGALDLWSAGGGQFNLRLTQLSVRGTSMALMPDSVLRVGGQVDLNVVSDNFGNTASENDTNFGSHIRLEAGYKVVDNTFLGMEWFGVDYRSTVDIYFSPHNYSSYDIFLEYEDEDPQNWYLRLRGAVGVVARSSGFISRRLEADYIKRLGNNFSVSLTTGMTASTRTLGSGASAFIDRYNTFTFGAALFWNL